ncbi:hypothetical protein L9F63_001384, partial [Diploptera punctata]
TIVWRSRCFKLAKSFSRIRGPLISKSNCRLNPGSVLDGICGSLHMKVFWRKKKLQTFSGTEIEIT